MKESLEYQEFLKNNTGKGNLKIRAYAASEALPVSGVQVIISTNVNGKKMVFYEGVTDTSGMINTISLPAPKLEDSNLVVPLTTTYQIEVLFPTTDLKEKYEVNMYDGICVIQNLNIIPGGMYGN